MKNKILNIITVALASVILAVPISADGLPFTDIPEGAWYCDDVQSAYESGLINGKSESTFAPNSYLTYAEAIKLAACMNQLMVYGEITLENGQPWYQSYVDYCADEGLITRDYPWTEAATRAGYMEIFACALPDSALRQINSVPMGSIPDVPADHPQSEAIYKLYRAGILQGSDPLTHACNPDTCIRRSEVCAIIARIMDSGKRISFYMGEEPEFEITEMPENFYADVMAGQAMFTVTATGENVAYEWETYDFAERLWISEGCTDATLGVDFDFAESEIIPIYRCVLMDEKGTLLTDEVAIYPPITVVEITKMPDDTRMAVSIVMDHTNMSLSEARAFVASEAPVTATVKGDLADGQEMAQMLTELGGEAVAVTKSAEGLKFVRLTDVGANRIEVIKLIHKYTGLSLTEAQDLVKQPNPIIGRGMTASAADKFAADLENAGAAVEVK